MNQASKDLAHKELTRIYNRHFAWIERAQILRKKFTQSLSENPELKLLLKLVVLANIGIWCTLFLVTYNFIFLK